VRRGLRTEVLELDRHVPGTALDTGRRDDICNSMQFQAEFQKAITITLLHSWLASLLMV